MDQKHLLLLGTGLSSGWEQGKFTIEEKKRKARAQGLIRILMLQDLSLGGGSQQGLRLLTLQGDAPKFSVITPS